VDSTRQDAGGLDTGAAGQPPPVIPPVITPPETQKLTRGAVTPEAVRALTNEQLNTELTNINLSDAEYGLVKTELAQRQQGTTSGTQTAETKQTETQGQKPPAAPAVKTAAQQDEDLLNGL
jgi:hypothetical protein